MPGAVHVAYLFMLYLFCLELEQTVNFAERKYGDLMQQLHFYKKYYEKWSDNNKVNALALKVSSHITG